MTKKIVQVAILGGGMGGLAAAYEIVRREHATVRFEVTVFEALGYLGGKGANLRSADETMRVLEHGLHVWLGFYRHAFRVLHAVYADLGRNVADYFVGLENLGFGPSPDVDVVDPPRRDGHPWDDAEVETLSIMNMLALLVDWLKSKFVDTLATTAAGVRRASTSGVAETLAYLEENGRHFEKSRKSFGWTMFDLAATLTRAILGEGLHRGDADWSVLDDRDIDDVLRQYGASDETRRSNIVRGYHDLAFTRLRLDGGAGMAAGTGLRGLLSMLAGYRGHAAYKMRAGMGEIVFAPIFRYLEKRGVTFKFGHAVTSVSLDDTGNRVDAFACAIDDGLAHPAPLANLPNELGLALEYWTARPDPDPRPRPPARVERFDGFHEVVLALPPAVLEHVATDIAKKHPTEFGTMLRAVRHTATRAAQVWWRARVADVAAWGADATLTALREPQVAFADMSHILAVERGGSQGLTYHCAPMDDPPARTTDEVLRASEELLFRQWLAAEQFPANAIDQLYLRTNTLGSERYVLSVAGTTRHRLAPTWGAVANLWLAGDWTRTSISAGCIEAAAESGCLAATGLLNRHVSSVLEPESAPAEPIVVAPPAHGGDAAFGRLFPPGPYVLDGVRLDTLFLSGTRAAMQRCLDHCLPKIPGVTFEALCDWALLTVVDAERCGTSDPRYQSLGWTAEKEVAIWIPLTLHVDGSLPQVVLFAPFLWVDEPLAIALGREVYGFNKMPAEVDIEWGGRGDRSERGALTRVEVRARLPDASGRLAYRPLLHVSACGVDSEAHRWNGPELFDRPPWLLVREQPCPGAPWRGRRDVYRLAPDGGQQWPEPSFSPFTVRFTPTAIYPLSTMFGCDIETSVRFGFSIQNANIVLGNATCVGREF